MSEPPLPREVSRAFDAFPPPVRRRLLDVRKLIFATAKAHDEVGPLTETLKWGEPAYLTEETGSGTTIRLGRVKDSEQPRFCSTARRRWSTRFASAFPINSNIGRRGRCCCRCPGALPKQELTVCLSLALTYHLDRRRGSSEGYQPQRSAAVRTTNDVVSSLAVALPEKLSQDRPCIGSSVKPIAITAFGFTK